MTFLGRFKLASYVLCKGCVPENTGTVRHKGFSSTSEYAAETSYMFSLIEEGCASNKKTETMEELDHLLYGRSDNEGFISEMETLLK